MSKLNFNSAQVPDGDSFPEIVPGRYNAVIISTDLEAPNAKGTQQLKIVWEITDGPMQKGRVTNWVTVACATQMAVDIGQRFLKNICDSIGLPSFQDTDEMCGRQHTIDVHFPARNDGKKFAEVKRCYPAGSAAAVTTHAQPARAEPPPMDMAAQTTQTTQTRPAAKATPPWAK